FADAVIVPALSEPKEKRFGFAPRETAFQPPRRRRQRSNREQRTTRRAQLPKVHSSSAVGSRAHVGKPAFGRATYPLAVARIVGREAEVAAVDAFLAAGLPGADGIALVGEPGIGKSTVWTEAVARARARGAEILVARPAESE